MGKIHKSVQQLVDAIDSFQTKRGKLSFPPPRPKDKVLGSVPETALNAVAFMKVRLEEISKLSEGIAVPHSGSEARALITRFNTLNAELAFAGA